MDFIQFFASRVVYQSQLINQHFDETFNYLNPMALTTDTSNNETYTFKEMLQQDDQKEFIKAMLVEI